MGFGDKLKGLKDQAQQAVAENRDKIQDAVQVVGDAANNKTGGKYAAKIAKVGEKVEASVDKLASSQDEAAPTDQAVTPTDAPDPAFNIEGDSPQEEASGAPIVNDPPNPVSPAAADTARAGFPEFDE